MIWGFMRYLSHSAAKQQNVWYHQKSLALGGITKRAWRWVGGVKFISTLLGVKILIIIINLINILGS